MTTEESHIQSACCDLVAEVARSHGRVRLKVTGASMLPVIRPGDHITVQRCNPRELQPGEIILFQRNGGLTAHRIVEASETSLITRGDSLPTNDAPIGPGEVVGRVELATRNGRTVGLEPSALQRLVAALLRYSECFTRIYLRLSPATRGHGAGDSAFGTADPVRS
jgi:signal peptidase I